MPAGVEGSFNSRTPEGVRQHYANYSTKQTNVSIHEPREGCDCTPPCQACPYPCFNSRTPGGVRPRIHSRKLGRFYVSIHAPREGCDCAVSEYPAPVKYVSIHAPREGCDCYYGKYSVCRRGFNSRTPGGVRHYLMSAYSTLASFQFTHPGRGATRET